MDIKKIASKLRRLFGWEYDVLHTVTVLRGSFERKDKEYPEDITDYLDDVKVYSDRTADGRLVLANCSLSDVTPLWRNYAVSSISHYSMDGKGRVNHRKYGSLFNLVAVDTIYGVKETDFVSDHGLERLVDGIREANSGVKRDFFNFYARQSCDDTAYGGCRRYESRCELWKKEVE